jgi:menaquinone-dependent protoporphyrinogen oxidase
MRALVTYGSKLGGTAELARMVGSALARHGISVDVRSAATAPLPGGYGAVVVGGALYNGRWHRDARVYVRRHRDELRRVPVWLFSSGPLGDTGLDAEEVAPTNQVRALGRQIGARGHETFGGRLDPDAPGLLARAMARSQAGDWHDRDQVERWADEIAAALVSGSVGR